MNKKSIFITGAASGIGLATARLFARKGWFVGGGDVAGDKLELLVSEIGKRNCRFSLMDVTDFESVRQAVDAFSSVSGGRMDILFNCAGILRMGCHDEILLADHHRIVAVNLSGILNCIHASFDLLQNTRGGRIINMSSASAVYGTPELAVYSATKFAVRGLTEALNIEFERHGIHVCDVMAPYVKTPMILDASVKATSVSRLGVRLLPTDVAAVVWKAGLRRKVHWHAGWFLKLVIPLNWAFPFARRFMVRMLSFSGK